MPKKIRLQVSLEIPDKMGKQQATNYIREAIQHWIAANPSHEINASTLKVVRMVS